MKGQRPICGVWWQASCSVLLALGGCGGTTTEVMTDPQIEQYRIVRIAVLPFTVEPPTVGQERGYAAPAPPPSSAEKVSDIFYRKLKSREGLEVVPSYQVQDVLSGLPEMPLTTSQVRSIGERLGVGAVLIGTVQVYKERSGSAMGLERPEDAAEVGFVARLISVKEGAILWTGQYYERQRPATEDLTGFLERGPRYLTVDQLANSAVEHVLRKFPFGRSASRISQ